MAVINGTILPDILVGTTGDDTINGGGALDVLSGGNGNDYIDGGASDDILNGDNGDDTLYGGDGASSILSFYNGGDGNDLMIGSPDGVAENFNGGDGIDTISFAMRNRAVDARLGIEGLPLLDSIRFVENVIGSRFGDALAGDENANLLNGGAGNDTIAAGGDNDTLIGGLGADAMNGGDGVDTAVFENVTGAVFVNLTLGRGYGNTADGDTYVNIENLTGSNANDTFIGDALGNRLDGSGGNDVLIGALGGDVLVGGDGIDTASYGDNQGGVFVNLMAGTGTNNAAQGDFYFGIENVAGSMYADGLLGDANVNQLDGGAGNDVLLGGLGADVLIGGDGVDMVSYEDNQGAVVANLLTGQGFGNAAQGDTYSGIENVFGTVFYDTLIGDNGANWLDGGRGADTLTGNGGADSFAFSTAIDGLSNIDTVTDFQAGVDKIVLDNAVFSGLVEGALDPSVFVAGAVATTAASRIVYDQTTGQLWFDSNGTGPGSAILFAVLDTKPALTAADFTVI